MNAGDVIGVRVREFFKKADSRAHFFSRAPKAGDRGCALMLINKGKVRFEFQDAAFTARKGDLVFWDQATLLISSMVPGVARSFDMIVFNMTSTVGRDLKLADIGFPYLVRTWTPHAIRKLISAVYRTFSRKGRYHLSECSALMLRLLRTAEEKRRFTGIRMHEDGQGAMDARIRQVLEFLSRNYKRPVDVPAMAKIASMHRSHFARLFKKATGLSPHRYFLELKIKKAQDFFLDSDYTPEHEYIALELGFHDYSHFYRTFKMVTGMTPRRFILRQRAR